MISVDYLGYKAIYDGDNREYLRDKIGTVVKAHRNPSGTIMLGVAYPGDKIEYGAAWAWELLPKETEVTMNETESDRILDINELFTEASGGKLEVAKNEIKRLEARIAELKKFVEVYESL